MNTIETLDKVQCQEEEIKHVVELLYKQDPDWTTFYREVLGLHGIARRNYPNRDSLTDFEQTEAFHKIQHMLTKLREKRTSADAQEEPTRVITVRIPKSLHETLRVEAHEHHTSMNKLCISKLLQFIDNQMIPNEV